MDKPVTILLVEPDAPLASEISAFLLAQGCDCTALASHTDLPTLLPSVPVPSLIVLCIDPKRTGWARCNQIRKDARLGKVPLIITSGEASVRDFADHRRLKTHADGYLLKPYAVEQLFEKTDQVLGTSLHTRYKLSALEQEVRDLRQENAELRRRLGALPFSGTGPPSPAAPAPPPAPHVSDSNCDVEISVEVFDFFISYPGKDDSIARLLFKELRARQHSVFFAPESFVAGSNFQKEIAAALKGSRVCVVLISEHWAQADYQQAEAIASFNRAQESLHMVVPILHRDASLPWFLKGISAIDTTRSDITSIADSLERTLERSRASSPRVGVEPPTKDKQSVVARAEGQASPTRTLGSRYIIKQLLGEGRMGKVYQCEDTALNRACAAKILHGRFAADPLLNARLAREAEALARLRSPHTVRIYDVGLSDGQLFLIMEALSGYSLRVDMDKGPLGLNRVVHVLKGVCRSLDEAHRCGIVHRDIKPGNIFLETVVGEADCPKVLDFGLAKLLPNRSQAPDEAQTVGPMLTEAGQTLGTLAYMSPEQLMGAPLDGRTDLYSLGILAHEALCGQHPFQQQLLQPGELITAHVKLVPSSPSQVRPDLPMHPEIDRIVMCLVDKSADKRFANAFELFGALTKVERQLGS